MGLLALAFLMAYAYRVKVLLPNMHRGEAMGCRSRLRQITLARGIWTYEHVGQTLTNLASLQSCLMHPGVFACPKDKSNPLRLAKDWSGFEPRLSSYEFRLEGEGADPMWGEFARCKFHGFSGHNDGSVWDDIWTMDRPNLFRVAFLLGGVGLCILSGSLLLHYGLQLLGEGASPAKQVTAG